MPDWTMLAGMVGSGMMGMYNDARQQQANEVNTRRQMENNKNMTDYNTRKQIELWENTGYGPQMEQMRKAGVNPALLYGKGGAGGQTAAISPGNVGMGAAPSSGGELGMINGTMQLSLMEAQKENIKANTEKTKVEAAKAAGVDTGKVVAEINSITQGIENQKAQEMLTRAQERIARISAEVGEGTVHEQIGKITYEMQNAKLDGERMTADNHVNRATMDSKIQILANQAKESIVNVAIAQAKEKNINVDTARMQQQIQSMIKDIEQKWVALGYQGRAVSVAEKNAFTQQAAQEAHRTYMEGMLDNAETQTIINGVTNVLRLSSPTGTETNIITDGPKGLTEKHTSTKKVY